MQLFIANGTHQVQDFHYRLPEVKQVRQQKIAVGGQIRITEGTHGLSQPQVDSIIRQHQKYGIIPADEIFKANGPAPLAYRVDRHITTEEMTALTHRNQGVLIDLGRESRKNAAIVLANTLGNSVRDGGTGTEFESAEVEITEEPGRGGVVSPSKIEEKTIVTREDRPNGREGRGRRGRR